MGTVSGYVFHDLDRDGVRDEGEPGLRRLVQLVQGDVIVQEGGSEPDGSYYFPGVPPGDYNLVTEMDALKSFCLDFAVPNFYPLLVAGCVGYIGQPWRPTTAERYSLSVEGGDAIARDFGATPFDQSVLLGLAILDGDYAPPGTVIEASVNGQVCGSTAVPDRPWSGTNYRIVILGAQEQAGCPADGQPMKLRVGGVDVSETPAYTPQVRQTDPGPFIQNLVAMPNHAWYWLQELPVALPPEGTKVEVFVEGMLCGETLLRTQSGMGVPLATGFHRLVVPSESVRPGCGHPGATVEVRVDGSDIRTYAVWQAGVQRLTLDAPPPEPSVTPTHSPSPISPSPTSAPTPSPAALPVAGGAPGGGGAFGVWLVAVFALATTATGLICLTASRSNRSR
jgi:hypothetical protein